MQFKEKKGLEKGFFFQFLQLLDLPLVTRAPKKKASCNFLSQHDAFFLPEHRPKSILLIVNALGTGLVLLLLALLLLSSSLLLLLLLLLLLETSVRV